MIRNIFYSIKNISALDYPCIVAFSTGRDSAVMLDLMMKNYKGNMTFVYYYFVPNLEYKERILCFYEKKYGIKIERRPSWSTLSYMLGRKIVQSDCINDSRHEFNASWIAFGTRRCESLTRRGILSGIDSVDEKNKYFYPVIEFTSKQIASYARLHNLALGEEYRNGFQHDLSVPDDYGLLYIKNQYPSDYKKIIETFPALEAKVKKIEMYRR